jgi:hypothetical protein
LPSPASAPCLGDRTELVEHRDRHEHEQKRDNEHHVPFTPFESELCRTRAQTLRVQPVELFVCGEPALAERAEASGATRAVHDDAALVGHQGKSLGELTG